MVEKTKMNIAPPEKATKASSKPAAPLQEVEVVPPSPRPLSPPPKGAPSGVMLALTRLAELEAQMEYAYAKHMLLVKRRDELKLQYRVLEGLPVGIDALQDDMKKLDA